MIIPLLIPTLAQFQKTDLVLAAGIMMVITGLVWSYRKRKRVQASTPILTPQEQLARNHQMRGVRGDLETLMVEIEQFSKRLSAHLDAKTAAMEILLKRVDDRIAQLEKLAASRNGDSATPQPDDGHMREARDDRRPGASIETDQRHSSAQLPEDPLSRSVYQLADQGLDAHTIAQRLQEHVGKIELILALRSA